MAALQIAMIWGAATAALFSFPANAGEWENFKDLKEALVRSSARRDVPAPAWIGTLDYKRPYHFWDVQPNKKPDKINETPSPSPAVAVVPAPDSGQSRHLGDGNDSRNTD